MKPTLIMTRSENESGPLLDELGHAGLTDFHVIYSPVMAITSVPVELPRTPPAHIILTSRHAAARAAGLGLPADIDAWCVGESTAKVATQMGFHVHAAGGDAAALITMIKTAKPAGPMLYLHGVHRRVDIAAALNDAGLSCQSRIIYDQPALPLTIQAKSALSGKGPVIVPLFSPRSAAIFTTDLAVHAPTQIAVISDATRRSIVGPDRFGIHVAPAPNQIGMVLALAKAFAASRGNTSP